MVIKQYILKKFFYFFKIIFFPLFLISFFIFLNDFSNFFIKFNINFYEIIYIFILNISNSIYFIMIVSFFVAIANLLTFLINSNKLVSILALGINIKVIIKIIFFISIFFSIILLFISTILTPYSYSKYIDFKNYKVDNYNININLSSPININNIYLYIKSKKDNLYQNVFIFRDKEENSSEILISDDIKMINNRLNKEFIFTNSQFFFFSKKNNINMIYDKLKLKQKIESRNKKKKSFIEYWTSNKKKKLLSLIYLSLSPLIFFNIILSFSIFHRRYNSNYSYLIIIISAISIYIIVEFIKIYGNYFNLLIILFINYLLGLILINNKVLKKF